MNLSINPQPSSTSKASTNIAESALATYGTILAVVLSIAAFAVGFSKTNVFVALAFVPMIAFFLHEFMKKWTGDKSDLPLPAKTLQPNPVASFLLQDSLLLRLSLSLLVVALIAAFTKANVAPSSNSVATNPDIISPLPTQ